MLAADVMTTNVITVEPNTEVRDIVVLLLKHGISAVPVVDAQRRILGLVSEGDLMRRLERDSGGQHSWWLELLLSTPERARDYIEVHGRMAADVMTCPVITVTEDATLPDIAQLLEKKRIKRVPVVRDGQMVGIVSRANLLQGLARKGATTADRGSPDDQSIRVALLRTLSKEAGLDTVLINVIVNDGVVQLWGIVGSASEKRAAQAAAENTPGVTAIENHLGLRPAWVSTY